MKYQFKSFGHFIFIENFIDEIGRVQNFIEIIVDSHAFIRNSTKRAPVDFLPHGNILQSIHK